MIRSLPGRLLTVVAVLTVGTAQAAPPSASAILHDATGHEVGLATLAAAPTGVLMAVRVHDLSPGLHGMHIHEYGTCEGPDFSSAGGHFNPDRRHHGLGNPNGPHAGDMPNLTVAADGTGMAAITLTRVTLGDGPSSLIQPGGTALVIHAKADDQHSDPAGNAGGRIACGVIRAADRP